MPPSSANPSDARRRPRCLSNSHPHAATFATAPVAGVAVWIPVALSLTISFLCLHWLFAGIALPGPSREAGSDGGDQGGADPSLTIPSSSPSGISQVFMPSVQRWQAEIHTWARVYQLDPNFVATVMQIESCGHPQAVSRSGAISLFQVMPYHFSPEEDPFDPNTNARRGLAYLQRSLELSGGRIDLALAGYNGGHGVIDRSPSQWSDETVRYVQWGSGIMQDIETRGGTSQTLDAWLAAGGSTLCRHAAQALGMEM